MVDFTRVEKRSDIGRDVVEERLAGDRVGRNEVVEKGRQRRQLALDGRNISLGGGPDGRDEAGKQSQVSVKRLGGAEGAGQREREKGTHDLYSQTAVLLFAQLLHFGLPPSHLRFLVLQLVHAKLETLRTWAGSLRRDGPAEGGASSRCWEVDAAGRLSSSDDGMKGEVRGGRPRDVKLSRAALKRRDPIRGMSSEEQSTDVLRFLAGLLRLWTKVLDQMYCTSLVRTWRKGSTQTCIVCSADKAAVLDKRSVLGESRQVVLARADVEDDFSVRSLGEEESKTGDRGHESSTEGERTTQAEPKVK